LQRLLSMAAGLIGFDEWQNRSGQLPPVNGALSLRVTFEARNSAGNPIRVESTASLTNAVEMLQDMDDLFNRQPGSQTETICSGQCGRERNSGIHRTALAGELEDGH